MNKFIEKETVASTLKKIEPSALNRLKGNLVSSGFNELPDQIVLLAFKEEQVLEVYGIQDEKASLIKQYPFTAYSGQLGPKLKEGDKQIPEGIYHAEYLNPNSSFYLSIKVNYPNELDKKHTLLPTVAEMGGDIFIHGKAATIGCIPIGDEAIEEVFLLCQNAMNNKVRIIISPRDFRKNKNFPKIDAIKWEQELYEIISTELLQYSIK